MIYWVERHFSKDLILRIKGGGGVCGKCSGNEVEETELIPSLTQAKVIIMEITVFPQNLFQSPSPNVAPNCLVQFINCKRATTTQGKPTTISMLSSINKYWINHT